MPKNASYPYEVAAYSFPQYHPDTRNKVEEFSSYVSSTPEAFAEALRPMKRFLVRSETSSKFLIVNAWNE